jgi:hypothetical protein
MKKYIIIAALVISSPLLAATTTGSAWSESLGWFNFGNVQVNDATLTGTAYNDNTGFLVMDGVTNTNGTLSGFAWSESSGWFDFSHVIVNTTNGTLSGDAYNDNTGFLSFDTGTNVTTAWRPAVVVTPPAPVNYGGGGGGGSTSGSSFVPQALSTYINNTQGVQSTTTTQACSIGALFNIMTGQSCTTTQSKTSTQTSPNTLAILTVTQNLKSGMTSPDIKTLQEFLSSQGFTIALTGNGSPNHETNYFGNLTKQALAKFQAKNNIKPSVGYFGQLTRAFIKTLTK